MTDEVARRLKWEIDAGRVWVTAYSNDFPCYIASKRVLDEGGYEADQSMVFYGRPARLAPEAEDLIIRTVHHLLPPGFDGGTERQDLTPPERLILTPLAPEDGRSGQERQFGFHSDFRLFLDFIDSRKR